jgi:uncharacterized protein YndB with AHSA1/START domain
VDRELLHRIDVMAGADALFRALTTSEGLAAFWTPASQAEPEVGSVAVFRFPQAPVELKMRVDELDEPRRVAWSCLGDFPFWEGTRIIWELGEGPQGGTKVVFRHTGWPEDYPDDEFGSVNDTWGLVVGALKAYAETGKPKPALP